MATKILCDNCKGLGDAVTLRLAVGYESDPSGNGGAVDYEYRDTCLQCLARAVQDLSGTSGGKQLASRLKKGGQ